MKKILLASLAVVASASMMAQTTGKLMEFKFDNTTMKDQVSGVEIPLAQGTPTLVDGPVAGSKAIHFDGNTWYNLEDCSKVTGTQLGKKEWTIVTWFKMDKGVLDADVKEGTFIEVGHGNPDPKFFQCEIQGSGPTGPVNLVFIGRYGTSSGKPAQALNSMTHSETARHLVFDGNWHMMVGIKSNAEAGPNWSVYFDGITSDEELSQESKEQSFNGTECTERRIPFQESNQIKTISALIDADLNYTGNLSLGHNVKDAGTKQLEGTLYNISLYEGVATTEQMQAWYNEVYPGTYEGTGGLHDVTVAPVDENAPMYNLQGVQVDDSYQGIVIKKGKKFINK